jgi:hypothetical protein
VSAELLISSHSVFALSLTNNLLAYCRTQRGDYACMVRRERLSVLRSDDFSEVGFISLSKHP